MGRNILAVIIGYIAMAIVVMVSLTGAYLLMGADRAFESGTYEITTLWMIVWGIASLVAALVGGVVCAKISKHSRGAVLSLLILTGVLGAANTGVRMSAEAPAPEDQIRTGDTPNVEAMTAAQAPTWVYIAEPIIGVMGILIGATLVCPRRRAGNDGSEPSKAGGA